MKYFIALAFFFSQAAVADDSYTPFKLRNLSFGQIFDGTTRVNEMAAVLGGMLSAVIAVQNLGLVPKNVCVPLASDGKPSNFLGAVGLSAFLRTFDTIGFPDTDEGGAMYIYSALLVKYPCK